MPNRDQPHDKLFKLALGDPINAALELRAILPPALATQLDFDSLKPQPDTFLDEAIKGASADLLFSVRYREHDALLYVLFEHKSRPHRLTMLQQLRYMVRIWEKCLAQKPRPEYLPPIIPVIVYHCDRGSSPPTSFRELFDPQLLLNPELARFTPAFEARLDDLGKLSNEALRARSLSPEATLGLAFLRDGRQGRRILDELTAWADHFRTLMATPEGQRAVHQLISYISVVTPELSFAELSQHIRQAIPETEELVMTIEEKLILQGRQEGEQKGYRKLVRRLIELKFGALDADVLARLEAADETTLVRMGDRVLTATSLEDVLRD
jgi:predicted transposase YdaD